MSQEKKDLPLLKNLKEKFDCFLTLAKENIHSRPWLVVMLMHEYYRNLWPADPYIPFVEKDNKKRILSVLNKNIEILKNLNLGYYSQILKLQKSNTQEVYRKLWDKFEEKDYFEKAKEILLTRFKNQLDFKKIKGKVLDMGCGSGRFAIALKELTNAEVWAVDLDRESIKKGEGIARGRVRFQVADVLKLPFKDNNFDFVFCNGVLHHTNNMEKGIGEFYRVLKPKSRAFLYIYGDGGLYWYSRKKAPKVMKKIPQEYTMAVLDLIGMPKNRFIFTDNWYVPVERHTKRAYLESYLKKTGFSEIKKVIGGRSTDLEYVVASGSSDARIIWGEGEHRYLMTKT